MDFLTHHGAKYFSPLQSSLFLIKPRLEWTYQVFGRDEQFYNSNSGWQGHDGGAVTKLTQVCSFAARWQSGPAASMWVPLQVQCNSIKLREKSGSVAVLSHVCDHDRTWIISRRFICKTSFPSIRDSHILCTFLKNCFQQSEYQKDYFF